MGAGELNQEKKTVLLADNHPIFRAGIRALIEGQDQYDVIGEVADGEACIVQAELLKPDILVTDLSMPQKDGFDVVRWAKENMPQTRSLILSMHSGREFVAMAREAGAAGFISKEDAGTDLLDALEAQSEFYMSSSAGRSETFGFANVERTGVSRQLAGLSRAEVNVLKSVAHSKTSREISEVLGISERTVHSHRQNISAKLDLSGANSLLRFAIRNRRVITELELDR